MVRYFIPGIAWIIAMWFLFLTPVNEPVHRMAGGIPARSLIHCVLFMGFMHLWLAGLKKQLKYDSLRSKAFIIVPLGGLLMILLSEMIPYFMGFPTKIIFWNVCFDVLGALFGITSFRLLYHKCY